MGAIRPYKKRRPYRRDKALWDAAMRIVIAARVLKVTGRRCSEITRGAVTARWARTTREQREEIMARVRAAKAR